MPRRPGIQYPGAIYHLMNRDDRREDIIPDDADRLLARSSFFGCILNPEMLADARRAARESEGE